MPRPGDRPPEQDDQHLHRGAGADPPQAEGKPATRGKRNDAALPGSQNADLKGAKRDRTLRGATT